MNNSKKHSDNIIVPLDPDSLAKAILEEVAKRPVRVNKDMIHGFVARKIHCADFGARLNASTAKSIKEKGGVNIKTFQKWVDHFIVENEI